MNILLIGSEGFIGGYMIRMLREQGHDVVGFDIRKAPGRAETYRFILGSIMNPDVLLNAMDGMEMVINLAARHHDFGISREAYFEINETGTQHILDAMDTAGIQKFLFYSTVGVYGDVQACSHEGMAPDPSNDYGESKLAAENKIREWVKRDAAREVIFIRPTVVFGAYNYANMYKLIRSIASRRFVLVGKGDNIKSVTYVENLVAMTGFVLKRLKPGLEIYNYSDYDHRTSKEIIDIICRCLGRRPYRWRLPLTPILAVTSVIDVLAGMTRINFPITANRIRKLNTPTWHGSDKVRALGFQQPVELEEGFRRMVEWMKGRNKVNSNKV